MLPDNKVIIEVGLNEGATKAQNVNVPYGVNEVIADGVECAEAGAAILHFHARTDDGAQVWSGADIYRAEMESIGSRSGVIMYPSYNRDYSAIWNLLDDPPVDAGMFMTPFDVFQGVGLVRWDEGDRVFREVELDTMPQASRGDRPAELDEIVRRGQVPTVCAQELSDIRWTRHAIEAKMITGPVALKLFVIDQFMKGAEPTPEGVDALLSHVTDEMEPMIVPSRMSTKERCERVLRHALGRGMHIRVGLGDNPEAFPSGRNSELVRWAIELAADYGRTPASPDEVRKFFVPARQLAGR